MAGIGKCFVCARLTEEGKMLQPEDSSSFLQNILEFPESRISDSLKERFEKVLYCPDCYDRVLNILLCIQVGGKDLEEREQIEKNLLLKDLMASCNDTNTNQLPLGMLQKLRHEIVFASEIQETDEIDIMDGQNSQQQEPRLNPKNNSALAKVKNKKSRGKKKIKQFGKRKISGVDEENPGFPTRSKSKTSVSEPATEKPNRKRRRVVQGASVKKNSTNTNLTNANICADNMDLDDSDSDSPCCGTSRSAELYSEETTETLPMKKIRGRKNKYCSSDESDKEYPAPESDDHSNSQRINPVPNTCFGCGEIFLNQNAWKLHVEEEHVGETKYKCKFCDAGCQKPAVLRKHLNIHHPDKKVVKLARLLRDRKTVGPNSGHLESKVCEECGNVLSSAEKLRNHMVTIHLHEGNVKCELCDFSCIDQAKLQRHTASCHSVVRNFQCEECYATFKLKGALTEHKQIHSGDTPHQCTNCMARFKTIQSLGRHEKARHCFDEIKIKKKSKRERNNDKEDSERIQIEIPPEDPLVESESESEPEFPPATPNANKSKSNQLPPKSKPEANENNSPVKYRCRFCTLDFQKPALLKNHLVLAHPEIKVSKYSTMLRKNPVQAKSRTSEYYQPKLCGQCGKLLSCGQTLKSHMLIVHPNLNEEGMEMEGVIKCTMCEFRCVAMDKLQRHIDLRHSDQRDFQCDICKTRFKLMYMLIEHMDKVHSESSTHQCKWCAAPFKNSTSRLKHELSGCCRDLNLAHQNEQEKSDQVPITTTAKPKRRYHARNTEYYKPKVCQKCGKEFKKTENWKIHMLTKHGEGGQAKFKCTFCDNDYSSPAGLRKHIARCHPREKNFVVPKINLPNLKLKKARSKKVTKTKAKSHKRKKK